MDQVVGSFLVLSLAIVGSIFCQEIPVNYNARSTAGAGTGMCPDTQGVVEGVKQDIHSLINISVLPALRRFGACGCGRPGWRRAAYLNMSDPMQTCPPAWELITTPRRSCSRPSNASAFSCYSAMFPTQDIQYSQVCGRIIGYQVGNPQAFVRENRYGPQPIDGQYVDGVSLTYGNPRQHIWTFAASLDETGTHATDSRCSCTNPSYPHSVPSFVGNSYFCETGVRAGQGADDHTFHADDPLWDGQGCGPTSTCCTFNDPPWFCKQLSQSTNADLEVRLCSTYASIHENTPVDLIEIYVK